MNLNKIPSGTPEEFNVIIEIPKGSSVKYEFDEALGVFKLDFVYQDLSFPFSYGFIPNTLAEDGDPLDVCVFAGQPLITGSVVACRAVGIAEVLDRGVGDNKIFAVPVLDLPMKDILDISDFSEEQLRQIEDFWREVAVQKNKIMEVKGFFGRGRATEEIKKSIKNNLWEKF